MARGSITRPQALADDSATWSRSPYGVVVGKSYDTYRESLAQTLKYGFSEADPRITEKEALQQAYDLVDTLAKADRVMLKKPQVSDCSIGGNDAINPLPGFCPLDDIVHPVHRIAAHRAGFAGMGRWYSEVIDGQQQILWLTFGVPHYNNLTNFYSKATESKLASVMENGYVSLAANVGHFIGGLVKTAFLLPIYPLIWTAELFAMGNTIKVTDYVKLFISMPLYFRMVNVGLAHMAVSTGLYTSDKIKTVDGEADRANVQKLYENNMPEIMENGPDINLIMNKRVRRFDPSNRLGYVSNDEMLEAQKEIMGEGIKETSKKGKDGSEDYYVKGGIANWFSKNFDALTGAIKTNALGGNDFIGFRIDNSISTNESLSNQTGESNIVGELNGAVRKRRDIAFETMNGNGAAGFVANTWASINNYLEVAKSGAKAMGLHAVAGDGYFDIPEQWTGSSATKSYSFTFTFRANDGGVASIFQQVLLPTWMLIVASHPRGTGASTYTSPFMLRGYMKGRCIIPYGIIDNISIERGDSEYGWNHQELPRVIRVTISIKDMSPLMFTHLVGDGIFETYQFNNKMLEYLTTMSGVGLKEQYYKLDLLKRRTLTLYKMKMNTWLSPYHWGASIGNFGPIKSLGTIAPYDRLSRD